MHGNTQAYSPQCVCVRPVTPYALRLMLAILVRPFVMAVSRCCAFSTFFNSPANNSFAAASNRANTPPAMQLPDN